MSDKAPEITPALRQLLADIGPRWTVGQPANVLAMTEAFSDLHRTAERAPLQVRSGIAYGTHPRQSLDVYAPTEAGQGRDCVVFVHGGAFTEGDRNRTPEIYANVTRYFARHGMVGVNIGYRLAPEAQHPDAARDVGAAIAWVTAHAEELGIDPARIFLMGHSAGGTHAASYAYDPAVCPADGPGIAGLIVVSGRVRVDNAPENPNARRVEAYFGTDATLYDAASGVSHVRPGVVPTFVAWSQYENALLDVYCAELVYRLAQARRRGPQLCYLAGHNHTSIIAHLDTSDDVLGSAIRRFIAAPD